MSTSARSKIIVHDSETNAVKYCFTVMVYQHDIFTTVTSDDGVITDWVLDVLKCSALLRIGLEYEYDLNTARVATLQLYVADRCLIVQLDRTRPLPPHLDLFLGCQNHTFISTYIKPKLALLRSHFPFLASVQTLDVCQGRPYLKDMKDKEMFKMRLDMGELETDWDRLPKRLSVNQVRYACINAFLLLYMWKPLSLVNYVVPIRAVTSITTIKKHYDVTFLNKTISTTVTKYPHAVKEWIDAVNTVHLAFEIEFDKTRRVRTLQLCDGRRCLVFQLLNTSPFLPPFLDEFLGDYNYTFLGDYKIQYNINLLKEQFSFTGEMNAYVTDDSIKSAVWKHGRLGSIGVEKNDWNTPDELSDKLVHFACVDAFVNLLNAWNKGNFFS